MTAADANDGSIIDQIANYFQQQFGPLASAVFVTFLVALSGRIPRPVCVRTVGVSRTHSELGPTLENLLGSDRALFLTTVTVSGFMALADEAGLYAIVYEGPLDDSNLRRAFERKFKRERLRQLDAPLTGDLRIRRFDRHIAIVWIHGDELADPDLNRRVLSVGLNDTPDSRRHEVERRLGFFTTAGLAGQQQLEREAEAIRNRLNRIAWDVPVNFDTVRPLVRTIIDTEDADRLEQLFSLVWVIVILRHEPTDSSKGLVVTAADVDFTISLLDQARLDDERENLGPRLAQFLAGLHKYLGLASNGQQPQSTRRFSRYDLQENRVFGRLSLAALDERLHQLEEVGMVESGERVCRRLQWRLTPRGSRYRRCSLAQLLRNCIRTPNVGELSATSGAMAQKIEPPAHATPSEIGANFGDSRGQSVGPTDDVLSVSGLPGEHETEA